MTTMNSWEIIKEQLVKTSRPRTFGRHIQINQCAELFARLVHNLTDREAATEAINKDDEVGKAIQHRTQIKALRDAGVIE